MIFWINYYYSIFFFTLWLGLVGNTGIKGKPGSIIWPQDMQTLTPGDQGPKGFPGREGDRGWLGY